MFAKQQLFMLHFAGGSCFSFDFMLPYLQNLEVHRLELPGRGKRMGQAFVQSHREAIDDYLNQIIPKLSGGPFALYGHSMGATLAAHITYHLEARGYYPERLIVSGNAGPGVGVQKNRYKMPKAEFLEELKRIGGMPDSFFEHPELVDYFIPILKADFEIIEREDKEVLLPFYTPLVALAGTQEEASAYLDNWKRFTRSQFSSKTLPGNHFFIQKHPKILAEIISQSFHLKDNIIK